jgi:membrane-bound serine protease (ClpP class)
MEFILNPNVAYVLLALSFLVTIFALVAPGTGVLEILSLFSLLLVGYTVANMAVNTWAIVLLLVGVILVILSLKRAGKWYFLAVSIATLMVGMLFVYRSFDGHLLAIDPSLAVIVSAVMGVFIWIIGRNTSAAYKLASARNPDRVVGMTGRAVTDILNDGSVYVDGENWSATSDSMITKGSAVIVRERSGLVLKVSLPEVEKPKKK